MEPFNFPFYVSSRYVEPRLGEIFKLRFTSVLGYTGSNNFAWQFSIQRQSDFSNSRKEDDRSRHVSEHPANDRGWPYIYEGEIAGLQVKSSPQAATARGR